VVVLTNAPLAKQLEINDWTHANDVHFISAETRGLFGCVSVECWECSADYVDSSAFNDFGPKFTCIDPTGEQPLVGMVVEIGKVRLFWAQINTYWLTELDRMRMVLLLA
jgi:ubiquitin-activating enzyme E1